MFSDWIRIQKFGFSHVWRWRPTFRTQEMDSLFWQCGLCSLRGCHVRVWSSFVRRSMCQSNAWIIETFRRNCQQFLLLSYALHRWVFMTVWTFDNFHTVKEKHNWNVSFKTVLFEPVFVKLYCCMSKTVWLRVVLFFEIARDLLATTSGINNDIFCKKHGV